MKKGMCHVERSEASAVSHQKKTKSRSFAGAQDDTGGGFFISLLN
jgi:hypothetical protein